jgi:hypothetical protein
MCCHVVYTWHTIASILTEWRSCLKQSTTHVHWQAWIGSVAFSTKQQWVVHPPVDSKILTCWGDNKSYLRYWTCCHVVYTLHTIASIPTEWHSYLKQFAFLSPIMFTHDNNAKTWWWHVRIMAYINHVTFPCSHAVPRTVPLRTTMSLRVICSDKVFHSQWYTPLLALTTR